MVSINKNRGNQNVLQIIPFLPIFPIFLFFQAECQLKSCSWYCRDFYETNLQRVARRLVECVVINLCCPCNVQSTCNICVNPSFFCKIQCAELRVLITVKSRNFPPVVLVSNIRFEAKIGIFF